MKKLKYAGFNIVSEAVSAGVRFGWHRAYKYTDKPTEETIVEEIENAVMNELCTVVNFE